MGFRGRRSRDEVSETPVHNAISLSTLEVMANVAPAAILPQRARDAILGSQAILPSLRTPVS